MRIARPRRRRRRLTTWQLAALDLVLTLGGDGTVLWVSQLLGDGPMPPVLSFSLGRTVLRPGDSVRVALSRWPMPTVCAADATSDWFISARETLHWNERRVQGVTHKEE